MFYLFLLCCCLVTLQKENFKSCFCVCVTTADVTSLDSTFDRFWFVFLLFRSQSISERQVVSFHKLLPSVLTLQQRILDVSSDTSLQAGVNPFFFTGNFQSLRCKVSADHMSVFFISPFSPETIQKWKLLFQFLIGFFSFLMDWAICSQKREPSSPKNLTSKTLALW